MGGGETATPNGPVKQGMVDPEEAFSAQAHHPGRAGDGSLSESQNGAEQQDKGAAPNPIEKERDECYDDGCKR